MTHKDIYTKFMIEYDKANITSSYPSLTKYEVATILDKAYLALIARKMTGNNPRLSTFESDTKSIEDLRPLIVTESLDLKDSLTKYADNEYAYSFKDNMLYYIEGQALYGESANAINGRSNNNEIVSLVNHNQAQSFKASNSNLPWIKQPVSFVEGNDIHILIDSYKHRNGVTGFIATYLKKPAKFAGDPPEDIPEDPGWLGGGDLPQDPDPGTNPPDIPTTPEGTIELDIVNLDNDRASVEVYYTSNVNCYIKLYSKLPSDSLWHELNTTYINTSLYDATSTLKTIRVELEKYGYSYEVTGSLVYENTPYAISNVVVIEKKEELNTKEPSIIAAITQTYTDYCNIAINVKNANGYYVAVGEIVEENPEKLLLIGKRPSALNISYEINGDNSNYNYEILRRDEDFKIRCVIYNGLDVNNYIKASQIIIIPAKDLSQTTEDPKLDLTFILDRSKIK